ncbi:Alpha/beta hydrolase fold-1 [Aspergillus lucknowensis]|uniref:Alpha/beta hydrolase fold-1 n=1 Tax=Aspergillus lucknowensis TaxID=176173 RepID=A0ABR4LIW6_9EURO
MILPPMLTILFLPGAWVAPSVYKPFVDELTSTGYDVRYAGYPSLNPINPLITDVKADTDAIASVLHNIVEDEGKDVLVLMHSYAGMPGAAAATGLSKVQRSQEDKPGGVVGLVFVGAFVVPEDVSCAGLQGGALPSWILLDQPLPNLNLPDQPLDIFAADVNFGLSKILQHGILPHSTLAFTSPQPHPAWADEEFHGRLAYIVTDEDQAVPKGAQYGMMSATGKPWIVKEMNCSHFAPFLDQAEETARALREIIEELPETQ